MTPKDILAIESLKKVKAYCDNFETCGDSCVFYHRDYDDPCGINLPSDWIVPSIWSDTDIALAKVLMSIGVDELYCPIDPHRSIYLYAANKSDMGEFKADAFRALCPGESIKLSVIAKEQA